MQVRMRKLSWPLQRGENQPKTNIMNEELQQAIDAGKVTLQAAEVLSQLQPGACCLHKSWGFGRVAEWSLLTGQIVIDFQSKKGHVMQAQYAAETLQPIPAEHILARKIADPAGVRKQAQEDPVSLLRDILRDHSGRHVGSNCSCARARDLRCDHLKKWWDHQEETQGRRPLSAAWQEDGACRSAHHAIHTWPGPHRAISRRSPSQGSSGRPRSDHAGTR